ncbi:MAG: FeoA family protein [Myxococcota bacterium]
MELGLLPGTPVQRTGQAPLGDPITYLVRGAVLGLRRSEASLVDIHT